MGVDKLLNWVFPPNNGGRDDGFNDSGIAHFSGEKFASLVREIIQNSLDAREMPLDEPVCVKFEIKEIEKHEFPGRAELRKIFERCLKESRTAKDVKPQKFFEKGIAVLSAPKIRLLKMSDYNTTGLSDNGRVDTWHNLTKGSGISQKSPGEGGSWGIGKNASYVLSELRTVFYSTMYKDNKQKSVHKAQGRSVLMSHGDGDERTVGTGFYGVNGVDPILEDIPEFLVRKEQGTTVCVAGFRDVKCWQDYINAAVVSSFFVAIHEKKLIVQVGKGTPIDAQTLSDDFNLLLDNYGEDDEFFADVKLARQMYDALTKGEERDIQLRRGLGHCKIRILAGDELPKQVGIVRNTGMMITADDKRLQRFPGLGGFVAVCICDNKQGNELLRRMENPKHDAFQTDHLEEEKEAGEKALKEMAKAIRDRIKEIIASVGQDTAMADETIKYLSDVDGDDSESEEGHDRDFERGVVITRRVRKIKANSPPKPPKPPKPDPDDEKKTTPPSSSSSRRILDVRNIRVVDGASADDRIVYFTPAISGKADLAFWIVGDEESELLELDDATKKRARNFNLVQNERVEFPITMARPVRGALRVVAFETEPAKEEK